MALLASTAWSAPERGFSVGPTLGAAIAPGSFGAAVGLELSGAAEVGSVYLWGSLGGRALVGESLRWLPSLELGAWFFVAAGVGYGPVLGDPTGLRHRLNLFFGFPILLSNDWYVHPFYRPAAEFGGSGAVAVVHELGVSLKFHRNNFRLGGW